MGAYELSLFTVIGINVILALSLNLISGYCGQISLGHAAFYGIGAYAAALAGKAGLPFAACVVLAMVVAGSLGALVGGISLRVRHDFLAITTMGVGFLFLGVVRSSDWLGGELGISQIPAAGFDKPMYLVLVLACAALVAAFSVYIKRSWMGAAFDAIADDEDTAGVLGIDVARNKIVAFAIGTALAGLAGALYAYYTRFIGLDSFGFVTSISVLSMVVIGGIGSVWGVVGATVLLTLMPELFRFINDYKLLVYGGLLFAVMRFAPGGLAALIGGGLTRLRRA